MFRKFSYATKLIAVVTITVFIPMLCVILGLYSVWENALHKKTNDFFQNNANTTISNIENSIKQVESTAFYVAANESVQNILLSNGTDSVADYEAYQKLREVTSNFIAVNDELESIAVKATDGEIYSYSKSDIVSFDANRYLQKIQLKDKGWLVEENMTFYLQEIRQYLQGDPLGQLVIRIDLDEFYKIIEEIDYSGVGEVYLVNDENKIIVSKSNQENMVMPEAYQQLELEPKRIYENVNVDGVIHTVCCSQRTINGWKLILAIPTQYYMQDVNNFQTSMLALITIIALIGAILIIIMARQLTKPLKKLAMEMEKVGRGELESYIDVKHVNEIDALNETFNQMVEDMRNLIENEYKQRVMMQDAEMKSLQMQINPHFLYNTLDTINWMARLRGNDDVGDITSALGKLMRYSLSKKAFLTIQDELSNLKDYVKIQDVRYGDKVTVLFNIDDTLTQYYIPKLLIQPILENAIVHGVEDKLEACTIKVDIYREKENIIIVVEDDGVGMTQEALEQLLQDHSESKTQHTSIGAINVNRRIQMIYGEQYGMHVQSVLGGGTKVTLRIGCLSEEPKT